LRLVRALYHRLPMQCADGKVDAWGGRLHDFSLQART
jgi:hypothetical protein